MDEYGTVRIVYKKTFTDDQAVELKDANEVQRFLLDNQVNLSTDMFTFDVEIDVNTTLDMDAFNDPEKCIFKVKLRAIISF